MSTARRKEGRREVRKGGKKEGERKEDREINTNAYYLLTHGKSTQSVLSSVSTSTYSFTQQSLKPTVCQALC